MWSLLASSCDGYAREIKSSIASARRNGSSRNLSVGACLGCGVTGCNRHTDGDVGMVSLFASEISRVFFAATATTCACKWHAALQCRVESRKRLRGK
jgi:hypothetical protein